MGGQRTTNPPIQAWRIPPEKGEQVRTPRGTARDPHSALMAHTPLSDGHLGPNFKSYRIGDHCHQRDANRFDCGNVSNTNKTIPPRKHLYGLRLLQGNVQEVAPITVDDYSNKAYAKATDHERYLESRAELTGNGHQMSASNAYTSLEDRPLPRPGEAKNAYAALDEHPLPGPSGAGGNAYASSSAYATPDRIGTQSRIGTNGWVGATQSRIGTNGWPPPTLGVADSDLGSYDEELFLPQTRPPAYSYATPTYASGPRYAVHTPGSIGGYAAGAGSSAYAASAGGSVYAAGSPAKVSLIAHRRPLWVLPRDA